MKTKFKELLYKKNISYDDAASILGISKTTIYELANGNKKPNFYVLLKIKYIFDVNDSEIWTLFDKID